MIAYSYNDKSRTITITITNINKKATNIIIFNSSDNS